ncbi:MAG: 16S rRNA (cytidine(1402)-2'-O)-methyltransferase [Acidobacteriota bacterium]
MATPIGNLGDLSPRARQILASVRLILAEDTRYARRLLNSQGVATPTRSLHEHNEATEVPALLARLGAGDDVALVSDAGTPLLADPGYRLVRACREAGISVLAVPGPSAVAAALSVSGQPPYPFTFAGFLPAGVSARRSALEALAGLRHTIVVFVSPHRLAAELAACSDTLGASRDAALLAELTKLHERCHRGTLAELAAWAAVADARGEYTLVVGPPEPVPAPAVDSAAAHRAFEQALASGLELSEARRHAARALGITRRELYSLLHQTGPTG